jgi:hypothetical protein
VFCGEWNIGRIYEVRGGPEHLWWFWALHFPSKPENLRTDNRVATLEAAKAESEASWRQWVVGSSRAFGAVSHCHWLSGHQATLVYGIGPPGFWLGLEIAESLGASAVP